MTNGWKSKEAIIEHGGPCHIVSCGAIVYEDKETIRLIHTYDNDNAMMHATTILKSCITSRKRLYTK